MIFEQKICLPLKQNLLLILFKRYIRRDSQKIVFSFVQVKKENHSTLPIILSQKVKVSLNLANQELTTSTILPYYLL